MLLFIYPYLVRFLDNLDIERVKSRCDVFQMVFRHSLSIEPRILSRLLQKLTTAPESDVGATGI